MMLPIFLHTLAVRPNLIIVDDSKCSRKAHKYVEYVGWDEAYNKWFHNTCVNSSAVEFSMLSENLFFFCDAYRRRCDLTETASMKNHNGRLFDSVMKTLIVKVFQNIFEELAKIEMRDCPVYADWD